MVAPEAAETSGDRPMGRPRPAPLSGDSRAKGLPGEWDRTESTSLVLEVDPPGEQNTFGSTCFSDVIICSMFFAGLCIPGFISA